MYSRLSGNCGYTDMFLFKPLQSRTPCCKHFSGAGCYGSIVIAMTDPWTRCNVICDFRRTVTFPVAFHRDPLLIFNYWLWRSSLQTNPSGAWFKSVRFEPTYKVHAVYTVPVRHADAPDGAFSWTSSHSDLSRFDVRVPNTSDKATAKVSNGIKTWGKLGITNYSTRDLQDECWEREPVWKNSTFLYVYKYMTLIRSSWSGSKSIQSSPSVTYMRIHPGWDASSHKFTLTLGVIYYMNLLATLCFGKWEETGGPGGNPQRNEDSMWNSTRISTGPQDAAARPATPRYDGNV